MKIELVILDFDGTLTDIDKEAVSFVDSYKTDLAERLCINKELLESKWDQAKLTIESNPSRHGWRMDGKIIAPAYADPLVMSTTIADLLIQETGRFTDDSRGKVLDSLFKDNYCKLGIAFKDEADRFLVALKNRFSTYIVTNSGTEGVSKKVQKLPTDHTDIPIKGDAKKYILVPEWKDVPEQVERMGFNRPLFLRRQKYWDVLSNVMEERGVSAGQVAVVGDIYELDLLLPEYKGMNVVLTPRNNTPDFEVQTVSSSQKGYVARNLEEVLGHLESLV